MKVELLLKSAVLLLLVLLAGCSPPLPRHVSGLTVDAPERDTARVSIYLTAIGKCPDQVSFTIDSFELYDGTTWRHLDLSPANVAFQQVRGQQVLLGLAELPAGDYSKARLHLDGVGPGGEAKTGVTLTLEINRDFSLDLNDSKCLFLTWHRENCPALSIVSLPHLSIHGQAPTVSGETLYVVCDDINTLYFVRSDTNFVTASMGFPGRPGEIRFNPRTRKLYLLSQSSRAIYVIDEANKRIVDRIALSSLIQPSFLALSTDGTFAYVTDQATDRVARVDLLRRIVAGEATVGIGPDRITFFEDSGRERLAISSKTVPKVFIVNPANLRVIATLAADIRPGDLLFRNGALYVTDQGSNAVLIYNLAGNRVAGRINTGSKPVSIIANQRGVVFVGHDSKGFVSVISPGQFAVQRRLGVDSGTVSLAVQEVRQLLYVAHRDERRVSVVDLGREKKIQDIPLGGKPFSMAVQE